MVVGGDTFEAEKYTHCTIDPHAINVLKSDLEAMEGELTYLKYIDAGGAGYVNQQNIYYGTYHGENRPERIKRLEQFIGEARVEIHHAGEMLWLMEAGKIFDTQHDQEKKEKWLQTVRTEPKLLPGEQTKLF